MRKTVFAFVIVAALLFVALPGVSGEGTNDADGQHGAIIGYISHGDAPSVSPNKMTIKIYQVGITDPIGTFNEKLDSQGKFQVELTTDINPSTNSYYIEITEVGYDILTLCKRLSPHLTTSNQFDIDFNGLTPVEKNYTITGEKDYIVMTKDVGSLKGDVTSSSGDKPKLNGVKITLYGEDGKEKYTAFTNGQGHYEFSGIEKGTYKLVASAKGFKSTEVEKVTVSSIEKETVNLQMEPYTGIDLPHWMTIGASGISIILLLAVSIHIIRSRRR